MGVIMILILEYIVVCFILFLPCVVVIALRLHSRWLMRLDYRS